MQVTIKNHLRGPYTLTDDAGIETIVEAPVPHKWLPGDSVLPTGELVSRAKQPPLVGIVDFLHRTGQGFTARGVPLYLFHPLSPSWPPFLVSSRTKPAANQLAVVSFEHWDTKWPRGGIQRLLGPVGAPDVEKAALRLRDGVGTIPFPPAATTDAPTIDIAAYKAETWDCVCNIDPEGCEDVDDVFAWRTTADGAIEFAIAIAAVAEWVKPGTPLDVVAAAKGTSVYENTRVVDPMLPTIVSERAASLRADGVARPTLALVWRLPAAAAAEEEPRWEKHMLTVQRAFTYENVLRDSVVAARLSELLTKVLGASFAGGAGAEDPHLWVEAAMVEYNTRAGSVLAAVREGLLRVHMASVDTVTAAAAAELAALTGCRELAWRGATSGRYASAADEAAVAAGHAGLGRALYAHASSPLRRYADLINQRVLLGAAAGPAGSLSPRGGAGAPGGLKTPATLNARAAAVKAYERDVWFLEHLRTDAITDVEGFCLKRRKGVEGEVAQWTVYVPEWRRSIRGVVAAGVSEFVVGQKVRVRAYCDLRAPVWSNRLVCSLHAHE